MLLIALISSIFFVAFFVGIILTFFLKNLIGKTKFFLFGFIISFFFLVISVLMIPGQSTGENQQQVGITTSVPQSVNTVAPVPEQSSKSSSVKCAEARKEIKEIQDTNTSGSGYAFSAVPNVGRMIEPCVDFSDTSVPPTSDYSQSGGYYENCSEADAAGVTPILEDEQGYAIHLDADLDGVACEH